MLQKNVYNWINSFFKQSFDDSYVKITDNADINAQDFPLSTSESKKDRHDWMSVGESSFYVSLSQVHY